MILKKLIDWILTLKLKNQLLLGIITLIILHFVFLVGLISANIFLITNTLYLDLINFYDNLEFEYLNNYADFTEKSIMQYIEDSKDYLDIIKNIQKEFTYLNIKGKLNYKYENFNEYYKKQINNDDPKTARNLIDEMNYETNYNSDNIGVFFYKKNHNHENSNEEYNVAKYINDRDIIANLLPALKWIKDIKISNSEMFKEKEAQKYKNLYTSYSNNNSNILSDKINIKKNLNFNEFKNDPNDFYSSELVYTTPEITDLDEIYINFNNNRYFFFYPLRKSLNNKIDKITLDNNFKDSVTKSFNTYNLLYKINKNPNKNALQNDNNNNINNIINNKNNKFDLYNNNIFSYLDSISIHIEVNQPKFSLINMHLGILGTIFKYKPFISIYEQNNSYLLNKDINTSKIENSSYLDHIDSTIYIFSPKYIHSVVLDYIEKVDTNTKIYLLSNNHGYIVANPYSCCKDAYSKITHSPDINLGYYLNIEKTCDKILKGSMFNYNFNNKELSSFKYLRLYQCLTGYSKDDNNINLESLKLIFTEYNNSEYFPDDIKFYHNLGLDKTCQINISKENCHLDLTKIDQYIKYNPIRLKLNNQYYKIINRIIPYSSNTILESFYPVELTGQILFLKSEGHIDIIKIDLIYNTLASCFATVAVAIIINYIVLLVILFNLKSVVELIDKPIELIENVIYSISEKDKFIQSKKKLDNYLIKRNNEIFEEIIEFKNTIMSVVQGNEVELNLKSKNQEIKKLFDAKEIQRNYYHIKINDLIILENKIKKKIVSESYFKQIQSIKLSTILNDKKVSDTKFFIDFCNSINNNNNNNNLNDKNIIKTNLISKDYNIDSPKINNYKAINLEFKNVRNSIFTNTLKINKNTNESKLLHTKDCSVVNNSISSSTDSDCNSHDSLKGVKRRQAKINTINGSNKNRSNSSFSKINKYDLSNSVVKRKKSKYNNKDIKFSNNLVSNLVNLAKSNIKKKEKNKLKLNNNQFYNNNKEKNISLKNEFKNINLNKYYSPQLNKYKNSYRLSNLIKSNVEENDKKVIKLKNSLNKSISSKENSSNNSKSNKIGFNTNNELNDSLEKNQLDGYSSSESLTKDSIMNLELSKNISNLLKDKKNPFYDFFSITEI